MYIFHNSRDIAYRSPFGAAKTGSTVRLCLDIVSEIKPDSVSLRVWFDNQEKLCPMTGRNTNDKYIYTINLTLPKSPGLLWYSFLIETDGQILRYANNPDSLGGVGQITCENDFKSYQITVYKNDFDTPDWFRGKIIYQIFPDRFYTVPNRDIPKKRDEYIIHFDMYEPISFNPHPYESGPACNDFYGGSLEGIRQRLPYIKSLGVGVIYLNPIFEAYSNHRYDTADYKKIDCMLGTEEDFKHLCEDAERLDIKIILDGVFSHTGTDSVYFNKYGSYGSGGAFRDRFSPYRSWYDFGADDSYTSWWGCSNLPNVNELEPSYLDYILRDDDSVIKKWLRLGASGWRLDVADELPDKFIEILRTEVKSEKSDAVVIGEVWEDASNKVAYSEQRKYLLGDELDSVMNYPFRDNVTGFLMGYISADVMDNKLWSIAENYPICVLYSLMNLLGTHDTMRIKSLFGGLNESCASTHLSSGMEQLATYRLMCAMFMQMTFPGVPSIYYGDEAGMQGGRDPFNREPFPWRSVDAGLIEYTKVLGRLRNGMQVLRTGFFKTLYACDGLYIYARYFRDGCDVFGDTFEKGFAVCGINRSFEPQTAKIDLSGFDFGALYSGFENKKHFELSNSTAEITVPPVGYVFISDADKITTT